MRFPTSITYRLALIGALATVTAAARPGASGQPAEILAAGPSLVTEIAARPWTAVAASGPVESLAAGMPADSWTRVRRGDDLAPEGLLRTGPRGRATLTRNGDVLLVDPESELVLPADGAGPTDLLQTRGKVLYEVHREPQMHFQVVTPYLVAGVKGTAFSVIVDDDFTAIAVSEGHVEVHATFTNDRVDLFTGDMAVLEGAMGRLEVQRHDDRERPSMQEESQFARRSRRDSSRLVQRAARDELGDEVLYDFGSGDLVYYGDDELKRLMADSGSLLDEDLRKATTIEDLMDDTRTLTTTEVLQDDKSNLRLAPSKSSSSNEIQP